MRSRRRFARSVPFFFILWQCCFFGRYHFFFFFLHFSSSQIWILLNFYSLFEAWLYSPLSKHWCQFAIHFIVVVILVAAMVARKLMVLLLLLLDVVIPCMLLSIGYHVYTHKKWCLCVVSSRMHNDPTEFVIALIRIPIECDAYMCWHAMETR